LSQNAKKDLRRFRGGALEHILRELTALETNSEAGHSLSGVLNGLRALEFAVKGSGEFRAVYGLVDDNTVCLVAIVGPHENVYREAERRVKTMRKADTI